MALIKCEECGKQISDKAESCPNCGNPIKYIKKDRVCEKCGGLVGDKASSCVHCGADLPESTKITGRKTNALAVTGFLFGLISLFIDILGILSILALVFSGVGLTQLNNKGEKGTGYAVFGFIFGLISLIYFIYKIFAYQEMISVFFQ